MPGVPPDALAQVKKGLRGLFNRRKQNKDQPQHEPTPTSSTPSKTTTAAAAVPATAAAASETSKPDTTSTNPAPPQPSTAAHPAAPQSSTHIAEPTQVAEAKAVDLNPMTETATAAAPRTGGGHGMSATSGPMGDAMAEEFKEGEKV